jgi:bifunctional UDP-N-acetylglucosamine pyrophosphorylase/glucosamine-1-phosphate N-acetyltransferase
LANLWGYKFSKEIFEYVKKTKLSERWEYELTDALNLFLKNNKFELIKIKEEFIDIWYPWNILDANTYFLEQLKKSKIKGKIEDWVTIKWNIILEKWAILKSGTYIEWNVYIWKGSQIWPNAYLRGNTCIWEHCKIWNAVEIKNSSIWNHTNVAHLSYIWDSIIWNNTNIWWWFIGANARHDKANIKVMVKWKLVDTWKRKLWIIIWDNVKTWINSSSMPWRIIENDSFTMPGEIVK